MQLNDYIQGNRRGKEANRLEREALNDPFLQGALDGFDAVEGDHVQIIEQLEEKYRHPVVVHHSEKRRFYYWAAAAAVLLLIGFGAYFFFEKNEQNLPAFAENKPVKQEMILPADTSVSETNQETEPLLAEKITKEVAPAQAEQATSPVIINDEAAAADTYSVSKSDLSEEAPLIAEIANKEPKQTISGKITDENGEPLVGVSIVEKGTQKGTVSNADGTFTLQLPADDSSNLIASYLGYKPQEINPSLMGQTVMLKQDNAALSEVVVVGYGTQKKTAVTGAVSNVLEGKVAGIDVTTQSVFGEKEFQAWCKQKADKTVCGGKGASVKVSFFIDENGKPSNIEYKKYSCEDAKIEMGNLLASSPVWTKTTLKVTMTVKW